MSAAVARAIRPAVGRTGIDFAGRRGGGATGKARSSSRPRRKVRNIACSHPRPRHCGRNDANAETVR